MNIEKKNTILQDICNLKELLIDKLSKNILFLQFIGTWYFLYHLPNEEDNKIECPTDNFVVPVGNSSVLIKIVYDKH